MKKYQGYMIGPSLRTIRQEKGYTVEKLAEITGISTETVNKVEQGCRNLSLKNLYLFMDVYGVDANTILMIPAVKNEDSFTEKLSKLPEDKRRQVEVSLNYLLDQAVLAEGSFA